MVLSAGVNADAPRALSRGDEGRIELDRQKTGSQTVTMEDSFSHIYGSRGRVDPASPHLLSEPAIVGAIALSTLEPNPKVPWAQWVGDYGLVRTAIENTYPELFGDFNKRLFTPGGFWKGNPAAHRQWKTKSGKAEFNAPKVLNAAGFDDGETEDGSRRFRLVTLRSNDQFNTTIYGYEDRFRGIKGTRTVLLMNPGEIVRAGLEAGQVVALESDADDGVEIGRAHV